jgi:hypothetical protein
MKTVESSAVLQPKQWAEKGAGKTIENRTKPELVPNQASKSNIVRGALQMFCHHMAPDYEGGRDILQR